MVTLSVSVGLKHVASKLLTMGRDFVLKPTTGSYRFSMDMSDNWQMAPCMVHPCLIVDPLDV